MFLESFQNIPQKLPKAYIGYVENFILVFVYVLHKWQEVVDQKPFSGTIFWDTEKEKWVFSLRGELYFIVWVIVCDNLC